MSPFASDGVWPLKQTLMYRHATAASGTDNYAKDGICFRACAINRFRQREAVRVIGYPHGLIELLC